MWYILNYYFRVLDMLYNLQLSRSLKSLWLSLYKRIINISRLFSLRAKKKNDEAWQLGASAKGFAKRSICYGFLHEFYYVPSALAVRAAEDFFSPVAVLQDHRTMFSIHSTSNLYMTSLRIVSWQVMAHETQCSHLFLEMHNALAIRGTSFWNARPTHRPWMYPHDAIAKTDSRQYWSTRRYTRFFAWRSTGFCDYAYVAITLALSMNHHIYTILIATRATRSSSV